MVACKRFDAKINVVRPGGWLASGILAETYVTEEWGSVEVISPQHLYSPHLGIDFYPTREQVIELREGKEVTLNMKQWA